MNRSELAAIALLVTATSIFPVTVNSAKIRQSGPLLTVTPSSIVIKVGDSANVSVQLATSSSGFSNICFSVEDFPTSGFVTVFNPPCVSAQTIHPVLLTVEATPAAAPQSFTAYVVATAGNWTDKVPINVTVQPAMAAWIPWSIILVFVLILLIPMIVKNKRKIGDSPSSETLSRRIGIRLS